MAQDCHPVAIRSNLKAACVKQGLMLQHMIPQAAVFNFHI